MFVLVVMTYWCWGLGVGRVSTCNILFPTKVLTK